MIRTLALLCFVAAPVFAGWAPGLRSRFGIKLNPFSDESYFNDEPRSIDDAKSAGWVLMDRHPTAEGFKELVIYCPDDLHVAKVCTMYDETSRIAGLQIVIPADERFQPYYDPLVTGFTKVGDSWTISEYFVENTPEARLAAADPTATLRAPQITLEGFYGKLFEVSTDVSKLDSRWEKQACVPMMGHHEYYDMTPSLECRADTIFPWFPLHYDGQVIGMGFEVIGNYTPAKDEKAFLEEPTGTVISIIVPHHPDCLIDNAEKAGARTLHTYFIDSPKLITCVIE